LLIFFVLCHGTAKLRNSVDEGSTGRIGPRN
jgi:hypothetical protein